MSNIERLVQLALAAGAGDVEVRIHLSQQGTYSTSGGPGSRICSGASLEEAAGKSCAFLVEQITSQAEALATRASVLRAAVSDTK